MGGGGDEKGKKFEMRELCKRKRERREEKRSKKQKKKKKKKKLFSYLALLVGNDVIKRSLAWCP